MNNQELERLNKSIEEYRIMQDRHIKAFETELMPDLELQNFERKRAFAEMKNRLDGIINTIQKDNSDERGSNDVDIMLYYTSQIKKILQSDAKLKRKINIYKEELKKHMNTSEKFKNALDGYAGSTDSKSFAINLKS